MQSKFSSFADGMAEELAYAEYRVKTKPTKRREVCVHLLKQK